MFSLSGLGRVYIYKYVFSTQNACATLRRVVSGVSADYRCSSRCYSLMEKIFDFSPRKR